MFDNISITFSGSFILLFGLLFLLIGASILFYRYTLSPLSFSRRTLLIILRSLSVFLIVFILFEPRIRFKDTEVKQPKVAVLIDNSQSMNIRDVGKTRAEVLIEMLNNKVISQSLSKAQPIYYRFSEGISQLDVDSISYNSFNGEVTDLSKTVEELNKQIDKENIQAAVLLTDGNYNIGKNPIYAAEQSTIPFFVVGIGDTNEQKDIMIQNVNTNNITFTGIRLPIDITIRSIGYEGMNVDVQLSEGSKVIDQTKVNLNKNTKDYPLQFYVEPKEEGVKKYTVKVSELVGELTNKNNFKSINVKVLKSKLRVLLFAGAPSPDVPALRHALDQDKQISSKIFVEKKPNEFYEKNFSLSDLDSIDCLIFLGFPSNLTSNTVITQLKEIIDSKKVPVLIIHSKSTNYNKLANFAAILPITWSDISSTEIFVYPAVTEQNKFHPLITLESNVTVDDWQQLPPIYKAQTIFKTKTEANVLAYAKIQNVILPEPLITLRNIARQKTIAITGYGLWRWQLLTQGSSKIDKLLPLLITNSIRWLTTIEDEKKVRVSTSKEIFSGSEPIVFTAQIYDEQLKPVDNADVNVEIAKGKEKIQIKLTTLGNGRYEGSLDGLTEGDYTFKAEAFIDGRRLGQDDGKFSVGQINLEYFETKLNKHFLEQLAFRTGGRYYDIVNANKVAKNLEKEINFSAKEFVQVKDLELWNWEYLATVIVLMFGIEWFLRKRSGML